MAAKKKTKKKVAKKVTKKALPPEPPKPPVDSRCLHTYPVAVGRVNFEGVVRLTNRHSGVERNTQSIDVGSDYYKGIELWLFDDVLLIRDSRTPNTEDVRVERWKVAYWLPLGE